MLTTTAGDYTFAVLDDGSAEIRRYKGRTASLDIPSTLKDHPVTRIGAKSFNWRFMVNQVAVPGGVTAIGEGAFEGCYGMRGIALPGSLTHIGGKAFAGCRALTGISLPRRLSELGDRAFDKCTGLTEITLPDSLASVGANPFSRCRNLERIDVGDDHPTLAVDGGMLYDKAEARLIWGSGEGAVTIPPHIRVLGDSAFYECDRLTEVKLPDGLEAILDHAFYGCARLTEVRIPRGVSFVGNAAFSDWKIMRSQESFLNLSLSSVHFSRPRSPQ